MNDHDFHNLEFLMNISDADFDDWLDSASDDDIDYALELIKLGKLQLLDDIDNFDEALAVIQKIKDM